MWVLLKTTPNLAMATMWRELIESQSIPCRVLAEPQSKSRGIAAPCRVLVPKGKEHVAEEIIRQI